MRKRYLSLVLLLMLSMTGCSSINKILYPNVGKGELYYNKVRTITKIDLNNGVYNDLILNEQMEKGYSQKIVSELEKRVKRAETVNYLEYQTSTSSTTVLGKWIQSSIACYGFKTISKTDNAFDYYMIKNTGTQNTYHDYLHIMRALTIEYGECTTEIYRKADNSILNMVTKQEDRTGEEMIAEYNEMFINKKLSIHSKWVLRNIEISVEFIDPAQCAVIYRFID